MAIEAILGGLVGGVTRLAPEVLGFFDKKNERKHELAMAEHNLKLAELQNAGKLAITDLEVEGKQFEAAMQAMKAGIEAQGKPTGIKWVDALNASVRPVITYWLFGLYSIAKTAQLSLAMEAGNSLKEAALIIWNENDVAMLTAVVTFFFVGRIWDRATIRSFK